MGSLFRFQLQPMIEAYGLKTFVETGTGRGDSLAWAANSQSFELLLSCEIEPLLAAGAIARFNEDQRVSIARMDSRCFVSLFARSNLPPALIWLDAHYPGAGFGLGEYDAEMPEERRLPLRRELEEIAAHRPGTDVVIIDDLRIYETGDYEDGPLPDDAPGNPQPGGADWVRTMFPGHHASVVPRDQGYLVLRPKSTGRKSHFLP